MLQATLCLSVLTAPSVMAAPVELVAGRVVSHDPLPSNLNNLGFVGDISSLR